MRLRSGCAGKSAAIDWKRVLRLCHIFLPNGTAFWNIWANISHEAALLLSVQRVIHRTRAPFVFMYLGTALSENWIHSSQGWMLKAGTTANEPGSPKTQKHPEACDGVVWDLSFRKKLAVQLNLQLVTSNTMWERQLLLRPRPHKMQGICIVSLNVALQFFGSKTCGGFWLQLASTGQRHKVAANYCTLRLPLSCWWTFMSSIWTSGCKMQFASFFPKCSEVSSRFVLFCFIICAPPLTYGKNRVLLFSP